MVNPIQGTGSGTMMQQVGQTRMTESQRSSFQEIISKYDPENLSQANLNTMGEELRGAGIGRTREVKSMLETAGFNVDQYAEDGPGAVRGKGDPGGKGKPQMQGPIDMQALQSFQEILNSYDLTNMSSEDDENLMNELTNSGLLQSGLILNIQA